MMPPLSPSSSPSFFFLLLLLLLFLLSLSQKTEGGGFKNHNTFKERGIVKERRKQNAEKGKRERERKAGLTSAPKKEKRGGKREEEGKDKRNWKDFGGEVEEFVGRIRGKKEVWGVSRVMMANMGRDRWFVVLGFGVSGKRPVKLQLLIHSISLWAEREEKIEGEEEEREKRGKGEEGEERKGHRIRNRILILMDEKDIGTYKLWKQFSEPEKYLSEKPPSLRTSSSFLPSPFGTVNSSSSSPPFVYLIPFSAQEVADWKNLFHCPSALKYPDLVFLKLLVPLLFPYSVPLLLLDTDVVAYSGQQYFWDWVKEERKKELFNSLASSSSPSPHRRPFVYYAKEVNEVNAGTLLFTGSQERKPEEFYEKNNEIRLLNEDWERTFVEMEKKLNEKHAHKSSWLYGSGSVTVRKRIGEWVRGLFDGVERTKKFNFPEQTIMNQSCWVHQGLCTPLPTNAFKIPIGCDGSIPPLPSSAEKILDPPDNLKENAYIHYSCDDRDRKAKTYRKYLSTRGLYVPPFGTHNAYFVTRYPG